MILSVLPIATSQHLQWGPQVLRCLLKEMHEEIFDSKVHAFHDMALLH